MNYHVYSSINIPTHILDSCSILFSTNYGVWRLTQKNIKLSVSKLKENYLFDDTCHVVICTHKDRVVGQAFFSKCGKTCWITQLVVDKNYRKEHIASTMLYHALNYDWKYAGILTSNPYAVKGLERATGSKSDPIIIQTFVEEILKDCKIPYLENSVLELNNEQSIINTNFDVDHTEIDLENGWKLGKVLPTGYEFFAFVKKN